MKNRIGILLIPYIFATAMAVAQRSPSTYDPARQAGRQPSQKSQPGFLESMLKRINPADIDYGERLEQVRSDAIETGMNELPLVLASVLIGWSFLVILHQNKERKHREIIAARFLAWYHNELVRVRQVAQDAFARNLTLKNALDEQAGGATTSPELQPATKAGPSVTENGAVGPVPAMPKTPAASHDLVAEINQLRQRVEVYANSEKVLQRKINDLDRRLQNEQQKNRSLKGD